MSQPFTMLVDDQDSEINYICPSLNQQVLAGAYLSNTWTTIKESSCRKGWFEYKFSGTGITIHIPTSKATKSAAVLLDNALLNPNAEGLFEALRLKDGAHNFTYGIGEVDSAPVFDYLTITPGLSTPLSGKTLIVDDADDLIEYKGNWATQSPKPLTFDYSTSLYRDTAHWTSAVGDVLELKFTGSSVTVHGIATNIVAGNITASYIIDGVETSRGIPGNTLDSVPNTEFFHAGSLSPGAHTLLINLTQIASTQAFGVDFITYTPSEDNISSLPGFELSPAANAAPKAEQESNKESQTPAIVGGIFGALGFLLLFGLAFFFWKRSQSKRALQLASNNGSYDDVTTSEKLPQNNQSPTNE